jgi:hypothetical protein
LQAGGHGKNAHQNEAAQRFSSNDARPTTRIHFRLPFTRAIFECELKPAEASLASVPRRIRVEYVEEARAAYQIFQAEMITCRKANIALLKTKTPRVAIAAYGDPRRIIF